MLTNIAKFIHLLTALGLLGSSIYGAFLAASQQLHRLPRLAKTMIAFICIALTTGTLLVHAKHFTFYTAWIDAAYLLVITALCTLTAFLIMNKKFSFIHPKVSLLIYLLLIAIFLVVIHDAVNKSTFLF